MWSEGNHFWTLLQMLGSSSVYDFEGVKNAFKMHTYYLYLPGIKQSMLILGVGWTGPGPQF